MQLEPSLIENRIPMVIKKCHRRIPFIYEPVISPDYTEHGVETGAKIDEYDIRNRDVEYIFNATKPLNLEASMAWIQAHETEFAESTVVIDTDDGYSLTQYRSRKPQVFLSLMPLNKVRHLNTLLNKANEELGDGGYIWCHCRTAVLKKKVILNTFPWGINYIAYLVHYGWHRFCAKMPWLKKIYFGFTKGRNRTYNRVEVLGRMYRAGFEVIDEEFRFGEFFVLARKVKAPIWDDEPTCGPLIKLRRVGKDGELIGVYKFRTMYSYSEYLQPYLYERNKLAKGGKFADDYRVNLWGKIFRKLWIDELPMILNVFKGDMKLVGVRPLSRHYYSLYTPEMQQLRIKVKPGLLPPFYYDRESPKTIEEVQESERRYIESYLKAPFRTDWRYFWGTIINILFRGKRSK